MSTAHIKAAVDALLKKHGFTKPPIDPEFIAEREGIDVVYVEFSEPANSQIHGFFDNEETRIYVNKTDDAKEKMFTIAHELGHKFLHQQYLADTLYMPRMKFNPSPNQQELEADEFATLMLAPPEMVTSYSKVASDLELERLFVVDADVLHSSRAL